jgi:methionyl-tRNA synthetase
MSTETETPAADDTITFDDFMKLKLRSGYVQAAEAHPNADRLLVLTVDVGEETPRTIVAGLATKYAPADLVGRTVIVVVNLKPAKLRGVVSQGMLLAAGEKDVEGLATLTSAVAPGTMVR